MSTADIGPELPTAVLYRHEDVARLRRAHPEVRRALPLTPVARAALLGSNLAIVNPRDRFTDCAQARAVVAVQRARAAVLAALAESALSHPAARELVCEMFNRAAHGAMRLWYTLGACGPWLVPDGHVWRRIDDRLSATEAMMRHILGPDIAAGHGGLGLRAPPLPWLYRVLRRLVLQLLACSGQTVVSGTYKREFGTFEALAGAGLRPVIAHLADGGGREYGRLLAGAWSALARREWARVALLPRASAPAYATFDELLEAIPHPAIRVAFALYRETLAEALGALPGLAGEAEEVVHGLRPRAAVGVECARPADWLVAAACGRMKVPRIVLARNSHAPVSSRLAEDSAFGYFRARFPEGLVDLHYMWSPLGAAAARQVLPSEQHATIRPFSPERRLPKRAQEGTGRRRILVADTYAVWLFPHSWIYQTSDEFIDGLIALARAVAEIPDTDLLVRAKHKTECDLETLVRLVDPPPGCEIKIRDVPIEEDLADADLLVSFRSTVIEEALHVGKPVLLWGGTTRYRYAEARTTPPNRNDRAAIYAVEEESGLAPMIKAILEAHSGAPLSATERARYLWPADTPGVSGIAAEIAVRPGQAPLHRPTPNAHETKAA